jgi:uncharacterized membrane protein YkgB
VLCDQEEGDCLPCLPIVKCLSLFGVFVFALVNLGSLLLSTSSCHSAPSVAPSVSSFLPAADVMDWHMYTNPTDMFKRRNDFNGKTPQNSHYIFASGEKAPPPALGLTRLLACLLACVFKSMSWLLATSRTLALPQPWLCASFLLVGPQSRFLLRRWNAEYAVTDGGGWGNVVGSCRCCSFRCRMPVQPGLATVASRNAGV